MRTNAAFLLLVSTAALSGELPALRLDPGPAESLDLAAGPGGGANAPQAPFTFVEEEKRGRMPKVTVTDARGRKWMVKFGEEAKAETFASRISWAAGYPVRYSYYVAEGQIQGAASLKRAAGHIDGAGHFRNARFQLFDSDRFREIPGGRLDLLRSKKFDPRELNGLKLVLLLAANWDVKPANIGILEIDGKRYAAVTDWGASLGDPASPDPRARKWNCQAFTARTEYFINGADNGYMDFNYQQYAGRHIDSISGGMRVDDVKWFVERMSRITDNQLLAGLKASGATMEEAGCFTRAIRRRLTMLAAAADESKEIRTTTTTTTTKKTIRKITK